MTVKFENSEDLASFIVNQMEFSYIPPHCFYGQISLEGLRFSYPAEETIELINQAYKITTSKMNTYCSIHASFHADKVRITINNSNLNSHDLNTIFPRAHLITAIMDAKHAQIEHSAQLSRLHSLHNAINLARCRIKDNSISTDNIDTFIWNGKVCHNTSEPLNNQQIKCIGEK